MLALAGVWLPHAPPHPPQRRVLVWKLACFPEGQGARLANMRHNMAHARVDFTHATAALSVGNMRSPPDYVALACFPMPCDHWADLSGPLLHARQFFNGGAGC